MLLHAFFSYHVTARGLHHFLELNSAIVLYQKFLSYAEHLKVTGAADRTDISRYLGAANGPNRYVNTDNGGVDHGHEVDVDGYLEMGEEYHQTQEEEAQYGVLATFLGSCEE